MKKNYLEKILDNIADIVTISVAVSILAYGLRFPFDSDDVPMLLSWILAVLALLAISGLWDRNRRMDRIEQSTKKTFDALETFTKQTNDVLERLSRERINPKDLFILDDFRERATLETADDFALTGITLTHIVNTYLHIIEKRLAAGVDIRIILLDMTDSNLEQMQQRGWGHADYELYKSLLAQSLKKLEIIASKPKSKGCIQVGFLPFYPSFAIDLINMNQPGATIWVSIFHHKLSSPTPKFVINASDDPEWFNFFKNQFDTLWESCRVQQLPDGLQKRA